MMLLIRLVTLDGCNHESMGRNKVLVFINEQFVVLVMSGGRARHDQADVGEGG